MKYRNIIIITLLSLFIFSCDAEDLLSELSDSKITAKEKLGEVINKAKEDFSGDAALALLYGREVDAEGEIDLQKLTNAFIYGVQSDAMQSNEFYVPVYKSSPVKSPLNLNTVLSFIKDSTAKGIMESVFGKLSTVAINPSSSYDDSPSVIGKMLAEQEVINFRTNNPETKIDMYLVPSKSIDSTVTNSADWIVNFYGSNSSLVLWLHPGTSAGTVRIISN